MEPQIEQRSLTTILAADVFGFRRLICSGEAHTLLALGPMQAASSTALPLSAAQIVHLVAAEAGVEQRVEGMAVAAAAERDDVPLRSADVQRASSSSRRLLS